MTIRKDVSVTKVPCNCEKNVVIAMSHLQAIALVDILNHVGGSPSDSPRGDTDQILIALENEGFAVHSYQEREKILSGSIEFKDSR